ncbi:hypothetical protein ACFOWA_00080 [Pedobacter lithocola]|uniref:Uncharacterized protein n=1 Tax=Pedobacter lithocola TaxID=1908239 RepID=A0ABV8P2Q6_9SPHI
MIKYPLYLYREFKKTKYQKLYSDFFTQNKMFFSYDKYEINFELRTKTTAIYINEFGDQYLSESFESFDEIIKKLLDTYNDETIVNINDSLAFIFEEENKLKFLSSLTSELKELTQEFASLVTNTDIHAIIKSSILTLIDAITKQENYISKSNITFKPKPVKNQPLDGKGRFSMEPNYFQRIELLFSALIEKKIISDKTDLKDFSGAFDQHNNNNNDRKLISWIAKSKSSLSSKPLLLSFIDSLIYKEIIAFEKPSVIKNKIVEIFANHDDSVIKIENLRVAASQRNTNSKTITPQQHLLDSVIQDFLSINLK